MPPGVREGKVLTRIARSSACEDTLPRVRLVRDLSQHNYDTLPWGRCNGGANDCIHPVA